MAFKPPPRMVQQLVGFKAIGYAKGNFNIWGNPAWICPVYFQAYLHKLMEKDPGYEKSKRYIYYTAMFQGKIGTQILSKRFGYAEKLRDKRAFLEFTLGNVEGVGMGRFKLVRYDGKKDIAIVQGKSPFAVDFHSYFGKQKQGVDYWALGSFTGCYTEILGKKLLGVETRCIAKGDSYCEFVFKPIDAWKETDLEYKNYKFLLKDMPPSFEKIGAKFKPYLQHR